MKKLWLLMAALVSSMFGSLRAQEMPPQDPRALSIYQIMVASFQHDPDGAPGYTQMWGPDDNTKNGNLAGIINSLDHIKSLGVNAIWLTPIFDSSKAFGGEKLQATGYFTNDYFAIDPHFGTEAEFKKLVDEAHKRGMYVILDGVFGHHGGVTTPSPSGYTLDSTSTESVRGKQGGTGNVKYPESLDYIKEVATYWIDKYDIDGWRLDQAYQACQGGHNYWNEIRGAVEELTAKRRAEGKKWGTLGYMVGEDWGDASVINAGVYKDGGLISAFDFDGKELISGSMQKIDKQGMENGWDDVIKVLSAPTARGYLNDHVMPNLFLSNHDGSRLADHFADDDPLRWQKMMTRHAILAAYSGPITLYYGDEYGDLSRDTHGGQPDNIARTSGHLQPRNADEARLADYVREAMNFRAANPAMWRGKASFKKLDTAEGSLLVVVKQDPDSDNRVAIIFSDHDTQVPVELLDDTIAVKAWIPRFLKLR